MIRLLIKRYYLNPKKYIGNIFIYAFVITVSLCFSFVLLVRYDNYIRAYNNSSFDFRLRCFDDNNIAELKNNKCIKKMYKVGCANSVLIKGKNEKNVTINFVEYWDEEGISYFGKNMKVKGNYSEEKNAIVIDALVANALKINIGDYVDLIIDENKVTFKVCMIIEPNRNEGDGQVVCVYNDYILEHEKKPEKLWCSYLFLETDNSDEIEDYLYNDYTDPDMRGHTKEEIKEVNFNYIDKKEWLIENVNDELEYTPPITVCISILSMIIFFIFLLRELTSKKIFEDKDIAILLSIGLKEKDLIPVTVLGQGIEVFPASIFAFFITKLIYDKLVLNYYLSNKLLMNVYVIVVIVTVLMCILVGIIFGIKVRKKQLFELLKEE